MEAIQDKPERKKPSLTLILSIAAGIVALAVFIVYCVKNRSFYPWYDFIPPFMALLLFAMALVSAMPKIVLLFSGADEFPAVTRKKPWRTFMLVVLGALALHIVLLFIGLFVYSRINPTTQFKYVWEWAWMKPNTDAQHYINIAENWYRKEGNDRLLIVFFPMLPVLIRGFNLITANSYASATIINALATALGAGMVYLTLREVLDEKRGVCGAFIALLLPGAIFMNSPMSEPLFLLFTFTAFYFMQKKRFILSGLFVALSGFTRSLGAIAAVPLFLIGLNEIIGLIKEKKPWGTSALKLAIGLVISTFGSLGYLFINWSIHGDPFKFLEYQWGNWYQKACPFYDTTRYMLDPYLINSIRDTDETLWAMWIPQFIAVFGSLMLMILKGRKLPASYTVYYLCYFAVAVGCTWLLSSVRYLSLALPMIAAFALMCDKKWKTAVLFTALSGVYVLYTYFYMMRWAVY